MSDWAGFWIGAGLVAAAWIAQACVGAVCDEVLKYLRERDGHE